MTIDTKFLEVDFDGEIGKQKRIEIGITPFQLARELASGRYGGIRNSPHEIAAMKDSIVAFERGSRTPTPKETKTGINMKYLTFLARDCKYNPYQLLVK